MNGFAVRGQYFNFSTTGQWMWDEIGVTVPASEDAQAIVEQIHKTWWTKQKRTPVSPNWSGSAARAKTA